MADGTDFSAIRELAGDIRKSRGQVGAQSAKVIRKLAADIEATAKTLAPVDTGNLKNSIGADITGDGRSGTMTAEIGPTAAYGIFVEYGTFKMSPQPFMNPAADKYEPVFLKAVELLTEDIL